MTARSSLSNFYDMHEEIRNLQTKILSKGWSVLKKLTFQFRAPNGEWQEQAREAYDIGNGATVLLYDKKKKTVILTRQLRIPTYLNGNRDGMLIEACAGKIENEDHEETVKREVIEETGYKIESLQKIFESYMSPGSVTELIHFYVAPISEEMRISEGGGLAEEMENIEVLEIKFNDAYSMIDSGQMKDAKTIMLLQYAKINQLLER